MQLNLKELDDISGENMFDRLSMIPQIEVNMSETKTGYHHDIILWDSDVADIPDKAAGECFVKGLMSHAADQIKSQLNYYVREYNVYVTNWQRCPRSLCAYLRVYWRVK